MATSIVCAQVNAIPVANLQHISTRMPRKTVCRRAARGTRVDYHIPVVSRTVCLTGKLWGSGHLVQVDGSNRRINQAPFDLLLEMALAIFRSPKAPFVSWWDESYCYRTEGGMRKIVERLRVELGSTELIHNNKDGGYCLAIARRQLECSPNLFHLSVEVSRQLLVDLQASCDQFNCAGREQEVS